MEKVMTQLLDLIKLPLPFVESLQKFDSLQEQKFTPYLRSLEDFMKPHHEFTQLCSEKIYDKTILIHLISFHAAGICVGFLLTKLQFNLRHVDR